MCVGASGGEGVGVTVADSVLQSVSSQNHDADTQVERKEKMLPTLTYIPRYFLGNTFWIILNKSVCCAQYGSYTVCAKLKDA